MAAGNILYRKEAILCIQLLVKFQLKYRKDGGPGQGPMGTAISHSKSEGKLLCYKIRTGWNIASSSF